jgi:hypothetical protein
MKCALFVILLVISSANALVYYQQDWINNGNQALFLDDSIAPFEPNCIVALANPTHGEFRTATVISPNFLLSCKHMSATKGSRIKSIGNNCLYLGIDAHGIDRFKDIYIVPIDVM